MTESEGGVVTLEMSGSRCPLPLLGAKRLLDDLPNGQTMVLISDCPGTADDLRSWASFTGYEVFQMESLNGRPHLQPAFVHGRHVVGVVT